MKQVTIEYFGHACFRISGLDQRIVLDPYADGSVPGLPDLRLDADFVYCSHGHHDHNAVECVSLCAGGVLKFKLKELETDHDDAGGSKRGKNTIRVFDFDGVRIAHFGDLGRPLTPEETQALMGLDCAMIPVGGFFTIDAKQAAAIAAELKPRMVIPMHYRTGTSGYDVIAPIDEALGAFDASVSVAVLPFGGSVSVEKKEFGEMTLAEKCGAYRQKGCNCCQSTLGALADHTGLDERTAITVGYGFGGGLLIGSVCGAVSGAMMAIGAACTDADDPREEKPRAVALCEALQARFRERFGTLMCEDILREHDHDLCDECIVFAAGAAEEIIRENRKDK